MIMSCPISNDSLQARVQIIHFKRFYIATLTA